MKYARFSVHTHFRHVFRNNTEAQALCVKKDWLMRSIVRFGLTASVRPFTRRYGMLARMARDNVAATLSASPLQPEIEAEDWLIEG